MTSVTQTDSGVRADVRTIVGGGIALGLCTAVGVVVFALVSRALSGTAEVVVQSILILAGGVVFGYFPAALVRPREVDSIAWASLVGLLGALAFTVVDTAILRPLGVYHWTWDAIGGGSGFWYIPVWWMGSAVLAWLGSWVYSISQRPREAGITAPAAQTVLIAIILFAILVISRVGPWSSAIMALAFALALVVHVPVARVLYRR